jgi:hypothetical protein
MERLAAAVTMLALGLGVAVVGILGVRHRIAYALGGWTREAATPESWRQAHHTIGVWLVAAGAVACASGVVALVVPSGSIGAAVVVGSIIMLVPTTVGLVRGLGRLERR